MQMVFSQVKRPKNKQEMVTVCDQFMQSFAKGKYFEAFDLVKPYTVIEDYKLDTLAAKAAKTMEYLLEAYGKVLSYELVLEKPVKLTLSRLTYLLKFQKLYLKLQFTMYNNGEGWTFIHFKWDDEIEDLFQ